MKAASFSGWRRCAWRLSSRSDGVQHPLLSLGYLRGASALSGACRAAGAAAAAATTHFTFESGFSNRLLKKSLKTFLISTYRCIA
jgi:hypothetical protein